MHILIIPSLYPSDLNNFRGVFVREQALALKKQGYDIGVIFLALRSLRNWRSILSGRYDLEFESDSGLLTYRKHGMQWFPLLPRLKAKLWRRKTLRLFKKYIAKHGMPDLIHVHSMLPAGSAAKVISEKFNIPYVVTEHSSAFAKRMVGKSGKQIASGVAKSATKRFAVSSSFAQLLEKSLNIEASPWDVMPNIVHERFFYNSIESKQKDEFFTFIAVAFLNKNKNIDVLIKAFAKALSTHPKFKLKIAGDGAEKDKLEKLASNLGVSENIKFLGTISREEVVDQISSSDAFVLSSQYETFGVVLVEALALGKPVVATRCGGPEDIVRKEDGILVPVNDIDTLAEAMIELYNQRDAFNSGEIRRSCHARFSEQVIVEKLTADYKEVIGNSLNSGAVSL